LHRELGNKSQFTMQFYFTKMIKYFTKMIKVEFTSTFDSPKNFDIICKKLGITYEKDPNYKQHFFGCDAPDVGYIVHTDNFQEIEKLATKDLYVENLIEY